MENSIDVIKRQVDQEEDFDRQERNITPFIAGILALAIAGGSSTQIDHPTMAEIFNQIPVVKYIGDSFNLSQEFVLNPETRTKVETAVAERISLNFGLIFETFMNGVIVAGQSSLDTPYVSFNLTPGMTINELRDQLFENTGYHLQTNFHYPVIIQLSDSKKIIAESFRLEAIVNDSNDPFSNYFVWAEIYAVPINGEYEIIGVQRLTQPRTGPVQYMLNEKNILRTANEIPKASDAAFVPTEYHIDYHPAIIA